MSIAYKKVIDTPSDFYILAREIKTANGIYWEEWDSEKCTWQRTEWACDAFMGFGDYTVNNVSEISEKEALAIIAKFNN